jgi:hypothetical protein
MPIIAVSPAESAGFNESRLGSDDNQSLPISTVSANSGHSRTKGSSRRFILQISRHAPESPLPEIRAAKKNGARALAILCLVA